MLGVMRGLGNYPQITYCSIGVVVEDIIYMVMDKAVWHKKNESVLNYCEYLTENYNIIVHHQSPYPPKTNMLDLGACMTIQ